MTITKRARFAVLTRDRFTCRYCGRSAPAVVLHVDHVHPRSRGGSDDIDNLVSACSECNLSKSSKVLPIDVSAHPAVVASPTFPHVDRCGSCRGSRLYAAIGEAPKREGYRAFYQCDVGHQWDTYWATGYRMTEPELFDAMNESRRTA